MLRLKINLRVRRSVRVNCPRHPRYNPEREGAGAIRGGCRYCVALYELYAGKLAVERSLQALEQHITRCASFNTAAARKEHAPLTVCLLFGMLVLGGMPRLDSEVAGNPHQI